MNAFKIESSIKELADWIVHVFMIHDWFWRDPDRWMELTKAEVSKASRKLTEELTKLYRYLLNNKILLSNWLNLLSYLIFSDKDLISSNWFKYHEWANIDYAFYASAIRDMIYDWIKKYSNIHDDPKMIENKILEELWKKANQLLENQYEWQKLVSTIKWEGWKSYSHTNPIVCKSSCNLAEWKITFAPRDMSEVNSAMRFFWIYVLNLYYSSKLGVYHSILLTL